MILALRSVFWDHLLAGARRTAKLSIRKIPSSCRTILQWLEAVTPGGSVFVCAGSGRTASHRRTLTARLLLVAGSHRSWTLTTNPYSMVLEIRCSQASSPSSDIAVRICSNEWAIHLRRFEH